MKKKIIIGSSIAVIVLAIVIAYFVFLPNNNYTSKVTDGDTAIIDGDITITKQGYYEYLLDQYGANTVLDNALVSIADKELTDTKAIDELVNKNKESYASYMGSLSSYATALGYANEEELINKMIIPDAKKELLRKQYLNDNFDQIITDYQVSYIKKIIVDKESDALDLIKKATSSSAFDTLMKSNTSSDDTGMVTKSSSSLDENLIKVLNEFVALKEDGVYNKPVKLSDDTYAVVFVYNRDTQKNKDTYIEDLINIDDLAKDIESIYLKKYEFNVYDEKIKKAIKNISDDYIQ